MAGKFLVGQAGPGGVSSAYLALEQVAQKLYRIGIAAQRQA